MFGHGLPFYLFNSSCFTTARTCPTKTHFFLSFKAVFSNLLVTTYNQKITIDLWIPPWGQIWFCIPHRRLELLFKEARRWRQLFLYYKLVTSLNIQTDLVNVFNISIMYIQYHWQMKKWFVYHLKPLHGPKVGSPWFKGFSNLQYLKNLWCHTEVDWIVIVKTN